MRILVAGWFSFEHMGATAGDLLACDLVCGWIEHAGRAYDVSYAPPFKGGVWWADVDPDDYTHVVFVCGPFGNGEPLTAFLDRFARHRLIGVDLSMLESLDVWNPFDILLERDSSRAARPDVTFLSRQPLVPVVGVVLVHPQKEYGGKGRHAEANAAIERLVASRHVAAVPIDTRLDVNSTCLRTAREVESLIARMDLVVTTRLHGTVLALKNGVPVIPVDPVAGGAKILQQVRTIDWPVVFTADDLDDAALQRAFDYCLTDEARTRARTCAGVASEGVKSIRDQFTAALVEPSGTLTG